VDATKNFKYKWDDEDDDGMSDNKCSDFYRGPHANSEPEIKLLSNFLLKHNKTIKLFVNLDGYGQRISFPVANSKEKDIDDLSDMARAGLRNVKMHRSVDKKYEINKDDDTITSGTVESFALYRARIKYSYRIEMMNSPQYSIFIPATSIERNANEILDVIKGMAKYLLNE
jgi:Zinc carboxypeptidase